MYFDAVRVGTRGKPGELSGPGTRRCAPCALTKNDASSNLRRQPRTLGVDTCPASRSTAMPHGQAKAHAMEIPGFREPGDSHDRRDGAISPSLENPIAGIDAQMLTTGVRHTEGGNHV